MVINRSNKTNVVYQNNTPSTSANITSVGSVANSLEMRISGTSGGAGNQDFELLAVAVFRRALTAAEISAITSYYQARLS
jgi:hypothetical protein